MREGLWDDIGKSSGGLKCMGQAGAVLEEEREKALQNSK